MAMTEVNRRRFADWFEAGWKAATAIAVALALVAFARDYQTRQLVDGPARDAAHSAQKAATSAQDAADSASQTAGSVKTFAVKQCKGENKRWSAYIAVAVKNTLEQRPGETMPAYRARVIATRRVVHAIRKVVVVPCDQ